METLQRLPFKARKAVFQKLEQIVDIAAMSKEDRIRYDESIKIYRDQLAVMEFEHRKGVEEGIEKGFEEGVKEGRMEERLAIARTLKSIGTPYETIRRATGLTSEEIASL